MASWRNKYGAKKVKIDGFTFDSKAEAQRYGELILREKAGEVTGLMPHPKFVIFTNDRHICDVFLDFYYWDNKKQCGVYEDVKGVDTAVSRLKRKLLKAFHGIDVEIIKAR